MATFGRQYLIEAIVDRNLALGQGVAGGARRDLEHLKDANADFDRFRLELF